MTKALWTGLDQLVAAHSAAKAIDLKHALDGMPVPLHPGAEKYYKEVGLDQVDGAWPGRRPMTATPDVRERVPVQAAEAAFDETGVKRELTGAAWKVVAGVALAFSTYQLLIAAFSPLSSLVTRSLHVGFLLLLAFLIHPVSAQGATAAASRGTTRCSRRSPSRWRSTTGSSKPI